MSDIHIDFWFTTGSTYSFLSVMSLADLERSTGTSFRCASSRIEDRKIPPPSQSSFAKPRDIHAGSAHRPRELENTRYRDR
jgi:hypothetical protein